MHQLIVLELEFKVGVPIIIELIDEVNPLINGSREFLPTASIADKALSYLSLDHDEQF